MAACRKTEDFRQLSEDEKLTFDDIITMLAKNNLNDMKPSRRVRKAFGKKIFEDWSTASEVPGVKFDPPERKGAGYMFHGGFAKHDLQVAGSEAAGANGATPGVIRSRARRGRVNDVNAGAGAPYVLRVNVAARAVPEHRRHGTKLFMKASLRADEGSVTFSWHDAKGARVAATDVALKQGATEASVRAATMDSWDRAEILRVGDFNHELAVYMAKNRLLRLVGDNNPMYVENFRHFYQLEYMRKAMAAMADLINQTKVGLRATLKGPSLF